MKKIIENDFSRIDLNLLTVLMVLYREGSVTRTAEVLHLGQPAISGALKRLREMFDDPLFVRSAGEFVPARAQQLFRIGLSDWSEHWLMPQLLPGMMQEAPGVSLQSIAADPFQVRQLLEEERIDVAVSVNKQSRGEVVSEPVMTMGVTTLWSPQQIPCRGPLSVSDFVAWEHVMVAYRETGHGEIDRQLASQGLARRVRFATQNFSTFPLLLTTLPLFATVPQGLAQRWQAQYALRADAPPVAYPEFTLCILRHKRRAQDPALNWLVTMLKQAMRGQ
ncbi:LysR substrate-binding domain-containing protein [Klebsiella pneumoniae]|nr:LysR substrate-binding domain-containing protein [Klebsiella pneumoniae]